MGGTPSQAQLKRWGKLTQEKYRRREGRFLPRGEKVVAELLASGRPLEALLVREDRAEGLAGLEKRLPAGGEAFLLRHGSGGLESGPGPEGVMAVALATPAPALERLIAGPGPLLILDRVANPNNLGALLRTAHWFGFAAVLLGAGSCEAANPRRSAPPWGASFILPWPRGWRWRPCCRR